MDTRIPLQLKTILKFAGKDGGFVRYRIDRELGRGGSCIVYDGFYVNNHGVDRPVRIKECYPFKLLMSRDSSGKLMVAESDEVLFRKYKEKMKNSFDRNNQLFGVDGLTNQIANTVDIYEGNNTVYIVTTYLQGTTLSQIRSLNLKEIISVVRAAARAIQKIHEKGYLYLDTKPENIFVIEGTTELVQLFDFDSLFPSEEINRISFTRGFAAPEVQQGQIHILGEYCDVYGMGALLFYLLFGRVPRAFDCEIDSTYSFDSILFSQNCYQNKLYDKLTEFFHRSIASYYRDRYHNMEMVIEKLDEICRLADPKIAFLHSSYVDNPEYFLGREDEMKKLAEWTRDEDARVLFLAGMGGIGKSSLCREFIGRKEIHFDNVLYTYYEGSLMELLTDDRQIWVNTLEKMPEESLEDYFARKMREIRKLVAGTKTLLVIDNYEWKDSDSNLLHEMSQIGWKLLILTRTVIPSDLYPVFRLNALEDVSLLYQMFERYLGRKLQKDELPVLDIIIRKTAAHTLTLKLLARQIASSYLTMEEALCLMKEKGFSDISPDKVDYVHDYENYHGTILEIIRSLFQTDSLSISRKTMLKILSVFSEDGVSIPQLTKWMGYKDHEEINGLKGDGWVNVHEGRASLHPVICEVIISWEWKKEYENALENVIKQICVSCKKERDNRELLCTAVEIISYCLIHEIMLRSLAYAGLVYHTVTNMPRDVEAFMIASSLSAIYNPCWKDIPAKMELYDQVIDIFLRREDMDEAARYLAEAKELAKREKDTYVQAQYYSLEADFYDSWSALAYDSDEVVRYNKFLLKSVDRAIHFMERSKRPGHEEKLGQYMLSKAVILIRNQPKRDREIRHLILSAKAIIAGQKKAERIQEYHMICGWYFSIVKPDQEKMEYHTRKAYDIYRKVCNTDIDFINFILIPTANMYLELNEYGESEYWIGEALDLCRSHEDMIPYIRKEHELYLCLYDIYYLSGQDKKRILVEKKLQEYDKTH